MAQIEGHASRSIWSEEDKNRFLKTFKLVG